MKKDEFVELDKIAKQEKLPEEEKQKITRIALDNLINAISIMTYLIVLMLLPLIKKQMFSITIYKTASMIILFLSIFIFEKAYKCDSGKLTISGIEVLILAIITLFAQYGFLKMQYTFLQLAGVYYGAYYIIKTIVLSAKIKRNYRKTVSDISEIVKKESKDKKAEETKTKRANKKENSKEPKKEIKPLKKKQSSKSNKEKTETTEKKRTTVKTANTKKTKTESNKKSNTTKAVKKETKENKPQEKVEEVKRKRGRPRKEQAND